MFKPGLEIEIFRIGTYLSFVNCDLLFNKA